MIPAVILAAGTSTRMGRTKASLPIDDADSFITRVVRTFHEARVDEVVVVIGHDAAEIVDAVEAAGLPARFVLNPHYTSGQLSSVLAGVNAVDRPGVHAMLLTLVDVPFVSAGTVQRVLDCYRTTRAPIVRPVSGTRHGHPILIDRSLFGLIRMADPRLGIKPIVRAHVSAAGDVPVDDEGAFVDVDTPSDYVRLTGRPID